METLELPQAQFNASPGQRLLNIFTATWVILTLAQFGGIRPILDWDMFHEMALARETLVAGRVPLADSYAYTPTIYPVIHHEWGMGMLLYPIARLGGMAGIFVLLLLLIAGILTTCFLIARRRGAAPSLLILGTLFVGPLGLIGYGAVRAQFVSILFMALELLMFESDRHRRRAWMLIWPLLYVAWVNIHGGFLVGLGVLGLYWLETAIRSRTLQPRLLLLTLATLALSAVSPYGSRHLSSVIAGTLLDRVQVAEWYPLWTDPIRCTTFFLTLVPLAYAAWKLRPRTMVGLPLVIICAILCLRHQRHTSLYGIAWLAYVPAWFSLTPAGQWFEAFWSRRAAVLQKLMVALALLMLFPMAVKREFHLHMPISPADTPGFNVFYPVGPVAYLQAQQFSGNLYTPFEMGSFVSWKLAPRVKVSIDSRYEVAYPPDRVTEAVDFYRGGAGWRDTLARYPTDLVLTLNSAKVTAKLAHETDWTRVYVDDVYSLFARPGLTLPVIDRTGQPLRASFP
jgi:hypothetical protein